MVGTDAIDTSTPCIYRFWPQAPVSRIACHNSRDCFLLQIAVFFTFLIIYRCVMLLFKYGLDADLKQFQARTRGAATASNAVAADVNTVSCFSRNHRYLIGWPRVLECVCAFIFCMAIYVIVAVAPGGESLSLGCDLAPIVHRRLMLCSVLASAIPVLCFLACAIVFRRFPT